MGRLASPVRRGFSSFCNMPMDTPNMRTNLEYWTACGLLVSGFVFLAARRPFAQAPSSSTPLAGPNDSGPTLSVSDADLPKDPSLIVYGDMRFTDPTNTNVANPQARKMLVDRVASLHPDALELTGDIPYAGGHTADYDEFRTETKAWRDEKLRIYPALGNHEFVGIVSECLKNWWTAFPELHGRRWYSVQFGKRIYMINLDSNTDLLPDSAQMRWLHEQVEHLPKSVDFVFVATHHPSVADKQTLTEVDHNPRPNEIALRDYISSVAPESHARFIVVAGHIHNYERFEMNGVTYLVSGGGGARPYVVERGPEDKYQTTDAVNFHYILFKLHGRDLQATMFRLADPSAQQPEWQARDSFVTKAR
jgi:acid phosphatase type 7